MLLSLSLLLSGCGFHLRGMIDMPEWFKSVSIIIEQANRDLGPILVHQFQAYHVTVYPESNLADYWLILERDDTQQQIASISSNTTARQYQLIYTVWFKLQKANGLEIIPTGSVVINRQITLNSNRILGSNNEEDLLKAEMRRDAVIQILSRINHAQLEAPIQHAH